MWGHLLRYYRYPSPGLDTESDLEGPQPRSEGTEADFRRTWLRFGGTIQIVEGPQPGFGFSYSDMGDPSSSFGNPQPQFGDTYSDIRATPAPVWGHRVGFRGTQPWFGGPNLV